MTAPPPPDDTSGFGRGMLTGALALLVAVHGLVSWWFSGFEAMYREMGPHAQISHATIFAIRPPWLIGVPTVGAAVVAWLVVKRPGPLWIYLAAIGAIVAALVFTVYFGYRPIWQLAGNISAD
ncbi:MAG TPA: hypothetical protein VFQ53_09305 [Kofleriaceae bacterium]|nr:hypothetical protein [Kofleriaceae bacterium]